MERRRENFKLNKDCIDGTSLSGHGLKALRSEGWAERWWEDAGGRMLVVTEERNLEILGSWTMLGIES